MASIIDHQYTHVGNNGVTDSGGSINRKIPGVAKRPAVNRPPSPPTTDTETDSEIPVNNTVSAPSGRQGLESQPRSTPTLTATIGSLVTAAAALDINSISNSISNSNPNPEPQTITADGAIEASEIAAPSTPDTPSVTSPITSPITSPPYWNFDGGHHGSSSQHSRSVSSASVESLPRGGIILRDNENSSLDERGSACWARSVRVTDWTVVNGSTTGIGAFVVFNIQVETLNVSLSSLPPPFPSIHMPQQQSRN